MQEQDHQTVHLRAVHRMPRTPHLIDVFDNGGYQPITNAYQTLVPILMYSCTSINITYHMNYYFRKRLKPSFFKF